MKLLLSLLVLSSLSSFNLARTIDYLHKEVKSFDEILVKTFTRQGSPFDILKDDPPEGPYVRFLDQYNSPIKKGKDIKFSLYVASKVEKDLIVLLKLSAKSTSHVPIKSAKGELKFFGEGYHHIVDWTISPSDYKYMLDSDGKVLISVSAQVKGKDQAWGKQVVVRVVD